MTNKQGNTKQGVRYLAMNTLNGMVQIIVSQSKAGAIDKTIEYVCPKCNGAGHTHIKRWVTLESLLKKGKK